MLIEFDKPHIPAGWQALTLNAGGATPLGLTIPTGARYAKVKVVTEPIRYRDDGTDPTSVVGYSIAANGEFELWSRDQLENFKAISQSTAGALEILYYKSH